MVKSKLVKMNDSEFGKSSFKFRATSALGISIIADLLDYFAAPVFDMPLLGDIFSEFPVASVFEVLHLRRSEILISQ